MGRKLYVKESQHQMLSMYLGATSGIGTLTLLSSTLSPNKAPQLWALMDNMSALYWAARNSVIYG